MCISTYTNTSMKCLGTKNDIPWILYIRYDHWIQFMIQFTVLLISLNHTMSHYDIIRQ